MVGKIFVNEAFSHALELYLKSKDHQESSEYQSFFAVAIRTLVFIYGELDIINPYITQNEFSMGGLDNNMTKYGFPKEKLQDFKQQFLEYEKESQQNIKPNTAFIKIEKYLIDMFFYKINEIELSQEEKAKFQTLLYLQSNQIIYIKQELEKNINQTDIIDKYYASKQYELNRKYDLEKINRYTLIPDAYLLLGYNLNQIQSMTDQDLQNVNLQVYNFFKVDINAENKDEILEKAINYYKRYGNRLTSGNGYVDMLLFASIIATTIFIVLLFIFNYL
ncbi:MAG: hypothetical protein IJ704_02020 [Bacilli bacterium]|nr:hypothetical protein [Bacilli bacterium]